MKKCLYILLLVSYQLLSQSKENLYIIFNLQEKGSCEVSGLKNQLLSYTIKKDADSILILTKKTCLISFLKKSEITESLDKIDACELINLKLHGYIKKVENKNLYLLIERKRKYKVVEIESISFYEKPQD